MQREQTSETVSEISLDSLVINDTLRRRPARRPDFNAENQALVRMARKMTETPDRVLQELATCALELCQAGSSGISIAETAEGAEIFRWHAMSGSLAPYQGQSVARDLSPCGVVLDRNTALLLADPGDKYPYIRNMDVPIRELLLVPFRRDGKAVGTIWLASHDEEKKFDSEDERVLTSLADFASIAYQLMSSLKDHAEAAAEMIRHRDQEQASERWTMSILESFTDNFQLFDAGWRLRYLNPAAKRTFAAAGMDPDAMIGKHFFDEIFPETKGTSSAKRIIRSMEEGVPILYESFCAPWQKWFAAKFDPLPDGGIANSFRDISEREQSRVAWRQSEERFRRAFELGVVGMAITSPTKGCLEVNEEVCRMLGYTREELLAMTWADLTHPDDLAADSECFERVLSSQIDGYRLDKRFVCKDGRLIDTTISVNCVRLEDGNADYFLSLIQDVTESKRAKEELRQARDDLELRVQERTAELTAALAAHGRQEAERKELLHRLVSVQEEERGRISRELHDQMGQHLTALMLRLRVAKDSVPAGSPLADQLQRLEDHAALIGRDAHRIALELRPAALDDLGLPSAILNHANEWSKRSGVVAEVRNEGFGAKRLPAPVETAIYRIIQEALTNVVRHAGAERVVITLNWLKGLVAVIVEDDGRGFDDTTSGSVLLGSRLGLLGMTERAALAGGTLEVESVAGGGTSILVRIPVPETAEMAVL